MKRIVTLFALLLATQPALADRPADKRLEEARLLQDLLDRDDTSGSARAEAMLRLGNLYSSHAATLQDDAEQREWNDKAARVYKDVLGDYRSFEGRAQALYRLGIALEELGKGSEGMDKLDEVVKNHPDSKWVPYAYHAMGEHFYGERNLYKAITSYRRAVAWPDVPFHADSRFKLAWSYFNARDYDDAIEQMKLVLTLGPDVGSDETLKAKAMDSLARFYADADLYDEGYAFFRDNGDRANLKAMLERMAALRERKGDMTGFKQVKKTLDKEFPAE